MHGRVGTPLMRPMADWQGLLAGDEFGDDSRGPGPPPIGPGSPSRARSEDLCSGGPWKLNTTLAQGWFGSANIQLKSEYIKGNKLNNETYT